MDSKLIKAILDCFVETKDRMSDEAVAEFINISAEDVTAICHFGLGLYLRNNLLKADSELYRMFITEGITHKDDMSSIMVKLWHRELNKE